MLLIRGCAYGLRRNFPSTIPGTIISPVYFARPVTLSMPSTRGAAVPMIFMRTFLGLYDFSCNIDRCEGSVAAGRSALHAGRRRPRPRSRRKMRPVRSGKYEGLAGKGETD